MSALRKDNTGVQRGLQFNSRVYAASDLEMIKTLHSPG
jgi:hypothetical protein